MPPSPLPLATPVSSSPSSALALAASTAVRSAIASTPPSVTAAVGRRELGLSACFTALTLSLARPAPAAVLEADDDLELLEKVKKDRKKRLEKQGVISSSLKEKGHLQEVIYKLSKVGQAIENNDLDAASSLLGPSTTVEWVQNVNAAFSKLSSSPEEKTEVDNFNSSLASLFASVGDRDVGSSKLAFVSSASALEKWVEFAGLVGQLKGL
ncbi:thylakoid lumenal 16.5 kDa protein, chloroplastic-like isoform X4 [Zingiber officinale]|nr:thylakoid lumenal 16.5 kDa protein, chloroplastic-like isoform X4 [Zingiber officinale]XP_042418993.1 thylakoid lumenal 16.5 kDa protein, chloroplastic-like isoform X4 [Zingiber officinale]